MMKDKITALALASLLLVLPATSLLSCSDDDNAPEGTEEVPGPETPELPQDLTDKIHDIYGRASTGPQVVRTVNRLAILTSLCASREGDGPISVTPAVLNGQPVTLVTLGGTENVEGQATTMKESQLAAFGRPNDYLDAVTRLFKDGTIPRDRPVLLAGISLGGMIAQQVLAQEEVLATHKIDAVITFGSPLTLPLERHGVRVIRFADSHDRVPQLGETVIRSGLATAGQFGKDELDRRLEELDRQEKIVRSGKYTGLIETHALSYIEDPCWNGTDFMGDPEKGNVLELRKDMKFYPAPRQQGK